MPDKATDHGGFMAKTHAHRPHDRERIAALGLPFSRRRWALEPIAGDGEHYRAVGLDIVPDAIREFMRAHRADPKKQVSEAS
jgi:hypothetical protein